MTSLHSERERTQEISGNSGSSLGAIVRQVAQDVSELTRSELALAKLEVEQRLRKAALSLAASLLGATVALIGLAMLCATAVVALAPLISPLWARMLLVSVIYLLFGGLFAFLFLFQSRREVLDMGAPHAMREARDTIAAVGREIKHN
jgi:uncharacterized membrane protein YqjE